MRAPLDGATRNTYRLDCRVCRSSVPPDPAPFGEIEEYRMPGPTDAPGAAARMALAAVAVAVAVWGVHAYPLMQWPLTSALVGYAALLWFRPAAFLLVVPAVLPAWDASIWTGWMLVSEADLFMLVTLAVLLIRTPPARSDLWLPGLPGILLALLTATWAIASMVGLLSPLGADPSDNVFLRPDNAERIAKGLAEALVLLPFLRRRQRLSGDTAWLLGCGITAGLVAVAVMVGTERALFSSLWDFSTAYRVAGPFSSMRVGGGHIGAYAALALPMTLCLVRLRPAWVAIVLFPPALAFGLYTLVVTFARTGYAAGLTAMAITGLATLYIGGGQPNRRPSVWSTIPVIVAVVAIAAASFSGGMRDRMASSLGDYETRRANWEAGLAVRDSGILPSIFGMGLGTYQRAMLMRSPVSRPSDLALRRDAQGTYLSIRKESPIFFGQKIAVPPSGPMHLTFQARSPDPGAMVEIDVCDKVLLYSDQCRGGRIALTAPGVWEQSAIDVPSGGLGDGWHWLRRPVELSFAPMAQGQRLELRAIGLTDADAQPLLRNGDFAEDLDRWIFTDDSHVSWRMLNVYLMLWFETGALGLAAYLGVACMAATGGATAGTRVSDAALRGAIAGFLVSGLFDNVLEAPRLATLFFLLCLCGLIHREGWGQRGGGQAGASG